MSIWPMAERTMTKTLTTYCCGSQGPIRAIYDDTRMVGSAELLSEIVFVRSNRNEYLAFVKYVYAIK